VLFLLLLRMQSKASCMPAHALQPCAGWHVVDCCAAPGNKTTHVAALLHAASTTAAAGDAARDSSSCRVFAFDKDRKRLKRLEANVQHVGAGSIVVGQHADFLSIDPSNQQFAQVCVSSGSEVLVCWGQANRLMTPAVLLLLPCTRAAGAGCHPGPLVQRLWHGSVTPGPPAACERRCRCCC
jgi:16S rRNA C967 or C1407 C5-methylase (RsmB/RsmF family)